MGFKSNMFRGVLWICAIIVTIDFLVGVVSNKPPYIAKLLTDIGLFFVGGITVIVLICRDTIFIRFDLVGEDLALMVELCLAFIDTLAGSLMDLMLVVPQSIFVLIGEGVKTLTGSSTLSTGIDIGMFGFGLYFNIPNLQFWAHIHFTLPYPLLSVTTYFFDVTGAVFESEKFFEKAVKPFSLGAHVWTVTVTGVGDMFTSNPDPVLISFWGIIKDAIEDWLVSRDLETIVNDITDRFTV